MPMFSGREAMVGEAVRGNANTERAEELVTIIGKSV